MKKHRGEYPMPIMPIPGWMSGAELDWLYQKGKEHETIVEIGSAFGRSSHALLTGNYETFRSAGRVYCVDPWPLHVKGTKDQFDYSQKDLDRRSTFLQRVGYFPNLNILELESSQAFDALKSIPVDMVFIDGGTAQMIDHFTCWSERPWQLLCGHDHSDDYPELKGFLEKVSRIKFVEGTSLWYVER